MNNGRIVHKEDFQITVAYDKGTQGNDYYWMVSFWTGNDWVNYAYGVTE